MSTKLEQKDCSKVQDLIKKSLWIIHKYDWLINSYVLDFYSDDHWGKLPLSWRNSFNSLEPEVFSELLEDKKASIAWPLSLLSLREVLKSLCIQRNSSYEKLSLQNIHLDACLKQPKLRNTFTKCVKSKKRHEIANMAAVCNQSAQQSGVKYVVDFGAGLGHLARVIAYGYGLNVCCLEMRAELNEQAKKIDKQFEVAAGKHLTTDIKIYARPSHLTLKLTKDVTPDDFVQKIKMAFNIEKNNKHFSFGIVGLHPCGDLAVILIKLFLDCPEAKFLNLVGCCYMKLTTDATNDNPGYPASSFLKHHKENVYHLSYESREIACHAIEVYADRLCSGKYENLKVHSYRAALEKIIVKYWPDLKHLGLKNVKYTNSLTFAEYCEKAVKTLDHKIPLEDIYSTQTLERLEQWKHVVIFYSLRLMFAPLVESVLLYDRILHILEKGCSVNIKPIFDPKISPRNHITTAMKQ